MPKILVISITRMGDIIQSIPFLRRLRARERDAEIHMLVESSFADVATLVPDVDRLITVRMEDLLPALASGRNHDLHRALSFYKGFVADLEAKRYEQVWNLTHTSPSMVLNYLLAGQRGQGVTLDQQGLQLVNSPWLRYFFATNLARPWCQFNLVDIYANCVNGVGWNVGRTLAIEHDRLAQIALPEEFQAQRELCIAIHPGASQKNKQWSVSSYRELAQHLLSEGHLRVVLIGAKPDVGLGQFFPSHPRLTNLIGRTTPLQLAKVLAECRVLVTNDSGPMHVAAAMGTRVIAITIGSAVASETAPYGTGHWVLEPEADCFPCDARSECATIACANQIRSETVTALLDFELGSRAEPLALSECAGSRIYRTEFSRGDGLLKLRRMFAQSESERDRLQARIRPVWLSVLEGRTLEPKVRGHDVPFHIRQWAETGVRLCREARELASRLADESSQLPVSTEQVIALGQQMNALDQELAVTLSRHGLLKSMLNFAWIAKGSIASEQVSELARENAVIFRQLEELLEGLAGPRPAVDQSARTIPFTEVFNEDYAERT